MTWHWEWYPDTEEIKRARDFIGWYYDADLDDAKIIYREMFGDLPCWVLDAPDGGLALAIGALYEAVGRLEDLER